VAGSPEQESGDEHAREQQWEDLLRKYPRGIDPLAKLVAGKPAIERDGAPARAPRSPLGEDTSHGASSKVGGASLQTRIDHAREIRGVLQSGQAGAGGQPATVSIQRAVRRGGR
jgi:hypothetical protein